MPVSIGTSAILPQESPPVSRPTTATETVGSRGSFTEREKNMRKYYKDDSNKDKLKVRVEKYRAEVKFLLSKIEDLEKYLM